MLGDKSGLDAGCSQKSSVAGHVRFVLPRESKHEGRVGRKAALEKVPGLARQGATVGSGWVGGGNVW